MLKKTLLFMMLMLVVALPLAARGKRARQPSRPRPSRTATVSRQRTSSKAKTATTASKKPKSANRESTRNTQTSRTNVSKTSVSPQVPSNVNAPYPDNFRCDVYAWNQALANGSDPRGQNGEVWDGNKKTVDEIYRYYPNNRHSTPPANSKGYGFFDNPDDTNDAKVHMEYYENNDSDSNSYTRHTTNGIENPQPTVVTETDSWTFVPLRDL